MNLDALEKMSTDALFAIRDRTIEVLRQRSQAALRIGAIGWILDDKGGKRFMRIKRVNGKSISAIEVDPITHRELPTRWRVGHNSLTIINTAPAPMRSAPAEIAPKTALGDSW